MKIYSVQAFTRTAIGTALMLFYIGCGDMEAGDGDATIVKVGYTIENSTRYEVHFKGHVTFDGKPTGLTVEGAREWELQGNKLTFKVLCRKPSNTTRVNIKWDSGGRILNPRC